MSGGIDDDRGRQFAAIEPTPDGSARVQQNRIVDATCFNGRGHFLSDCVQGLSYTVLLRFAFFGRLVVVLVGQAVQSNSNYRDALAHFFVQRCEIRDLRQARRAPDCPEIQDDNLSVKVGQSDQISGGVSQ